MQNVHKNAESPLARLFGEILPDLPDSAKDDDELLEHINKYLLSDVTNSDALKAKLSEYLEQDEVSDNLEALKGFKYIADKKGLRTIESITDYLESQRKLEFNKFLNEMSQVDVEMEEDVKQVEELLLSFENVSPAQLNKAVKKTKEDENETVDYFFEEISIQGKKLNDPNKSPVSFLSADEMGKRKGGNSRGRFFHDVKAQFTEVFYPSEVLALDSIKLD